MYNIVAYTSTKYITIIITIYYYIEEKKSLNYRKISFIDIALFNK